MDIKKIIIMHVYVFTRIDSKVVLGLYSNRAIGIILSLYCIKTCVIIWNSGIYYP